MVNSKKFTGQIRTDYPNEKHSISWNQNLYSKTFMPKNVKSRLNLNSYVMKNALILLCITLLFISSCKDDDDNGGPTRTDLISKTWVFEEVIHIYTTNGNDSVVTVDLSNSDYEHEFRADGTHEVRNDGQTHAGTWAFFDENTLHTILDTDPETIHSSPLTELTANRLWITHASSFTINGVETIIVSEIKHKPK